MPGFTNNLTTLPDMEDELHEEKMIFIRIHDHDKFSAFDIGKALASYVRINKLNGYPDFKRSKDGVYAFVLQMSPEEMEQAEKEREARQSEFDRRIMELVRMEMVTPNDEAVRQLAAHNDNNDS